MLSIDLLYYEDCSHYEEAAQALREALDEEDVLVEVHVIGLPGEDAEVWGFIGSPTIHINGQDLAPEVDYGRPYQGHCRVYIYENKPFEFPQRR
jgi:hypothetical protein